mgnify:CR=1 FL=1
MQIKISTRHGHLSEATQEKIRAKLEKLTRHFERLTEVELTVDLGHKDQPAVELRVNAEHKHDFVATAEAKDGELMAAVDSVLDNVPHMIFVKDAKDLRFVRFNRAGEDLIGRSREEMIFDKEKLLSVYDMTKDDEPMKSRGMSVQPPSK